MDRTDRYQNFALVREMLETPSVIRTFAPADLKPADQTRPVLLTGEGSSRLFPAKRAIAAALAHGDRRRIITEGCRQASEYQLDDFTIYVASNSGRTAEAVRLITGLRDAAAEAEIFAVVAHADSPVYQLADHGLELSCGAEKAVAATKSVVEQTLVYHSLFASDDQKIDGDALAKLADAFETTLEVSVPAEVAEWAAGAGTIYFAGRNNGVAEELTLKTNEIVRRKSDYLEGTYAVHGIEEVMESNDLVVVIDPFPEEERKYQSVLAEGAGVHVVAIADRQTSFTTIRHEPLSGFSPYLQLAAGWNLLVEAGLRRGVDLDTPARARKVGNEFTG